MTAITDTFPDQIPSLEKDSSVETPLGRITTDWRNGVMLAAIASQILVLSGTIFTPALNLVVTGGLLMGAYYVDRCFELQSIRAAVKDLTGIISKFDQKSGAHFESLAETSQGFNDLLSELQKTSSTFQEVFEQGNAVGLWQETIAALKQNKQAEVELKDIEGKIREKCETLSLLSDKLSQTINTLSVAADHLDQKGEELLASLQQALAQIDPNQGESL